MVAELSAVEFHQPGDLDAVRNLLGSQIFDQLDISNHRWEWGPLGIIDAEVPTALIHPEEVPVDEDRVAQLQSFLLDARRKAGGRGTGIVDTVLLGYVEGSDGFDTADGFHRMEALRRLNSDLNLDSSQDQDTVSATILLGCTAEELMDQRVAATSNNHDVVAFARRALLILKFWETKPWKEHITAAQAFGFAAGLPGEGFGLSREMTEEIAAWALEKSDLWRVDPKTLRKDLELASIAAPDLAISVRGRSGGSSLAAITSGHLRQITKTFMTRDSWPMQRYVAGLVVANNMSTSATSELLKLVGRDRSVAEIEARVEGIDLTKLTPVRGKSRSTSHDGQNGTALMAEVRKRRELDLIKELGASIMQLELASHRRGIVVPRLDIAPEQIFAVDTSGHEKFDELLASYENGDIESQLADARRSVVANALKAGKIDPEDLDMYADVAVDRTSEALRTGPLRVVKFRSTSMLSRILARTLNDELRIGRGQINQTSQVPEPNGAPGTVIRVGLDQVFSIYNRLSQSDVMVIARHGILGLDRRLIAEVTESDLDRTDKALAATRLALYQTTSKVAA